MNITGTENINQMLFSGMEMIQQKEPLSFQEVMESKEATGNSDMMYYLQLQMEVMKESCAYQAISNVMRVKHDAATNAIRNIR
jgi:aspartate carbamoyltransferase catalytic subunit